MILPDLGYLALILAFIISIYGVAAGAIGSWKHLPALVVSSQRSVLANAFLLVGASGILLYALFTHDFRIRYVAETSSRDMGPSYLFTSFWGGQAGSLLFWALGLTLFSTVAVYRSRKRYPELTPYVGVTLLVIQAFFLLVLSFLTNPFERLQVAAFDGQGLNPLLRDPGMRLHPPMLLTGYMSFSIPFAFAVAALISGRLGKEWLGAIRRWMLLSWSIQGAGLLLGAWWAYHVLGWGGYWGWDAVENAALMPWLTSTAFIHSTMVQERRGMLKVWNLSLVLLTFTLAIFGTFVVRSGVLSSVHAFATSSIGPYFFVFLGLVIISCIALIFFRLPKLQTEGRFDSVLSRESSFLVNNLLVLGVTAATFWGTIFPLISEVFRGSKISVGAPFYNQVNGPLFLALILLMGIGPMLAWRRSAPTVFGRNVLGPVLLGTIVGVLLFILGIRSPMAAFAYASIAFVFGTIWLEFYRGTRLRARNTGESYPTALFGLVSRNRRRYGGYIVHLALLLVAVGIVSSYFFQQQGEATLATGQSMTVGGYTLTNRGLFEDDKPGVAIAYAVVEVRQGNRLVGVIRPEKRLYASFQDQPVTGVAVMSALPSLKDVYVLISDISNSDVPSFRVFINPLVSLIWLGGLLLLGGTLVAAWPATKRREAVARRPVMEALPSEA